MMKVHSFQPIQDLYEETRRFVNGCGTLRDLETSLKQLEEVIDELKKYPIAALKQKILVDKCPDLDQEDSIAIEDLPFVEHKEFGSIKGYWVECWIWVNAHEIKT